MNPRVLTEMEHGVATVRLDAPPLNAFDSTMRQELTDAVAALEVDDSLRVVPEVLLGIMPGSGGTQRLRALVGPSRAKELLMSGRRLCAADAAALGLVDEVVSDECVHDRALQYAQRLAAGPRFALSAIKEAVDHAGGPAGLALERALIAGLFATEDRARGMRSFIEHGPGRAEFG